MTAGKSNAFGAQPVVSPQIGLIVVTQPAGVAEDHRFKQRTTVLDRNQLVDLLLILDEGKPYFGVLQHIGHLVGDRVLINWHWYAAERLRCGDRPVEPRPVVSDDRQLVAAAKPQRLESGGQRLDFRRDLDPAPTLPDAVILLAHRRLDGTQPGVFEQHFWKGV